MRDERGEERGGDRRAKEEGEGEKGRKVKRERRADYPTTSTSFSSPLFPSLPLSFLPHAAHALGKNGFAPPLLPFP
jgi:hypothetical protein